MSITVKLPSSDSTCVSGCGPGASALNQQQNNSQYQAIHPDFRSERGESETRILLTMPGVPAAQLRVVRENDELRITGHVKTPEIPGHRVAGPALPRVYESRFRLGSGADGERITAKISQGIATIVVPDRVAATAQVIPVTGA